MNLVKVAIPTTNGKIDDCLQDCSYYSIFAIHFGKIVDQNTTKILQKKCKVEEIAMHLSGLDVHVLIVGNISSSEIKKIQSNNIQVIPCYKGTVKKGIEKYIESISFKKEDRNVGLLDLIDRMKRNNVK